MRVFVSPSELVQEFDAWVVPGKYCTFQNESSSMILPCSTEDVPVPVPIPSIEVMYGVEYPMMIRDLLRL